MRANDPFRRYKPEPSHEVRQAVVKPKTPIEELRARREMLRSLDPEKAKAPIEFTGPMDFFKALELAQRGGKLIVPNFVHDRILTETKDEELLRQLYKDVVWTGTIAIYEAPDKPFGDHLIIGERRVPYSVSFIIPKQFIGKTNCALIVEHPDFELVALENNRYELKVADENIHLVENFPREFDNWHHYDERFRLPIGEKQEYKEDINSRRILRPIISNIVTLIRNFSYLDSYNPSAGSDGRLVDVYFAWSTKFGVALF